MKQKLFLTVIAACILTSITEASVFERDLVPGSGDGLLTFDEVHQREWLDLTQTQVVNFSMGYESVVMELESGGLFEGFAVANREDVTAFAESAGIDTSSTDFATNEAATEHLIGLLGSSFPGRGVTLGQIDELSVSETERFVAVFFSGTNPTGLTFHTPTSNPIGVGDRFRPFTGVMLFRQVPEPSSWVLFLIACLVGLHSTRRNV